MRQKFCFQHCTMFVGTMFFAPIFAFFLARFLVRFLACVGKVVLLALFLIPAIAQNLQENTQENLQKSTLTQIQNYIVSAYRTHYADFDFVLENIEVNIPKNAQGKIQKLTLPNNAAKKTSGTLIATIMDSKSVVSVPISYTINASVLVLQARISIKSSTDITTQNAFATRVNLSLIKANPLPPKELGKISARSLIAPNSIITRDKIQDRILVRKGDKITCFYKSQSMQAQITLQALQNGQKGNVIKAQNLQSGKILQVRIIDEGVGEIL
ncbi:flagellar basal body P-ring formation chaperone FlgA [Helicobacter sp. T3_23-1059]